VIVDELKAHDELMRVSVAYHSGYGHTAKQAEAVANGAGSVPNTDVCLLPVTDLSEESWQTLDRSDAIVFGTPTYMGGPSAQFKAFADASSKVWYANQGWEDKVAAGFTNSGGMSGDKLNTR
jgi:NAD(P)H dehydrogenase (quinone)